MMGLNKLGTAITAIIAVTLFALAVEIIYLLWRRRRQRHHLRVRIEPKEASLSSLSSSSEERERDDELELELEQQIMKFRYLYGPSRVLFTIKEEEREGLESENCSSAECSAVVVKKIVAVDEGTLLKEEESLNEATTPFSTPCASPLYYTPHSSPIHEAYKDNGVG